MADIVAYLAFLSTDSGRTGAAEYRLQHWATFHGGIRRRALESLRRAAANCHGPGGEGSAGGRRVGPRSYNIGAGMARVRTAAEFIRRNMPFDQAGTLPTRGFRRRRVREMRIPVPIPRKEGDWPNGDPPPDVAYPTRAQQKKPLPPLAHLQEVTRCSGLDQSHPTGVDFLGTLAAAAAAGLAA